MKANNLTRSSHGFAHNMSLAAVISSHPMRIPLCCRVFQQRDCPNQPFIPPCMAYLIPAILFLPTSQYVRFYRRKRIRLSNCTWTVSVFQNQYPRFPIWVKVSGCLLADHQCTVFSLNSIKGWQLWQFSTFTKGLAILPRQQRCQIFADMVVRGRYYRHAWRLPHPPVATW